MLFEKRDNIFYVRDDDDERPPGWPGYNNLGMYILALVVVFFIAILVEFLSHSKNIKEDADNLTAGLLQTTLYGLRIGLAYVVMLAVMSFNAGVFLVAIVGHRGRASLQGITTMVHFKGYTSPSSKNKYLLIEANDGTILSKLLTHTPLVGDSNSHVEILASDDSSSKTPLAIKRADNIQVFEDPHRSKLQGISDSVVGPKSRESLLVSKEVTSNPCGNVKANIESNLHGRPGVTMSIFDGKKVVLELKKEFIMKVWASIHTKIVGLTLNRASSI
ncbi:Copper transporter 1 [Capsicum chinense]|nr:Copper transporter 1 [Capsicum chinense]